MKVKQFMTAMSLFIKDALNPKTVFSKKCTMTASERHVKKI